MVFVFHICHQKMMIMKTKVKSHIRKTRRKKVLVRKHTRRIKQRRFRRVKTKKSLDKILNYSSFKVYEDLGKRKKEALMTAGDVKRFFRQYPEYRLQTRGLKKISLLEDREPSMKISREAKTAPGMYLSDEKEIRLFPIKPTAPIPPDEQKRAKKLYFSKGQFPATLPHELWHHAHPHPELVEARKLSDKEISSLPEERKKRIEKAIFEEEKLAEQAEDIWLEKMRRRR